MPMGMTYTLFCRFRQSGVSYRRRFPVVYLTFKAMRRPRLVNEQLEVCAFFLWLFDRNGGNDLIAK